jgi:hypothetical protein
MPDNQKDDGFVPFSIYSNWCYCDTLDGDSSKSGGIVLIKWPDGSVDEHEIIEEKSEIEQCCQPSIRVVKWYIEIMYKGEPARIRLVNSNLLGKWKTNG